MAEPSPDPDSEPNLAWPELTDEERQLQYSPSSAIGGDFSTFIQAYEQDSETARELCAQAGNDVIELRYGPGKSQTIDLVAPSDADGSAPLLAYLHGGYWQLLSKRESFFGATGCLDQGIAFAALDYTLAPEASLDEIVQECRAGVQLLGEVASEYGYDRDLIFVAGSSAGGHLSAMMGLAGVDRSAGGLGFEPAGLVLISGVFDLEPLIGTTINDAVGLTPETAHRNSPMLADLQGLPPTLLAWGDIETDEFKRQSKLMGHKLGAAGVQATLLEIPDRNHFDIVHDLTNPQTLLGRALSEIVFAPDSH